MPRDEKACQLSLPLDGTRARGEGHGPRLRAVRSEGRALPDPGSCEDRAMLGWGRGAGRRDHAADWLRQAKLSQWREPLVRTGCS